VDGGADEGGGVRPFTVATFRHSWDHARGGATVEVREDENAHEGVPPGNHCATHDPQSLAKAFVNVMQRRALVRRSWCVLTRLATLLPPIAADRFYCADCGKRMEPKPGRKYCSTGCRARAWKWEHRKVDAA